MYTTTSINLAAYLELKGLYMVKLDFNNNTAIFSFDESILLQAEIKRYFEKTATVTPIDYNKRINIIKEQIRIHNSK